MILIKPSAQVLTPLDRTEVLQRLELAGRTCYKSEDKITADSAAKFVEMLIKNGHESVLEHFSLSVRFICDRGVSHELVRHRLASFSQESTRYCNYTTDKFKGQVTFVIPPWCEHVEPGLHASGTQYSKVWRDLKLVGGEAVWYNHCLSAESTYEQLIDCQGWTPQQARSVLPNSLKTEVVVTANLREWRLIFKQRTSTRAHPQMREVMIPLCNTLRHTLNPIFDDIKID